MTRQRVCYNCKNRTYDCHGKCEMYKKECEEIAKEKAELKKKKDLQFQLNSREREIRYKVKQKKGKPGGVYKNVNKK